MAPERMTFSREFCKRLGSGKWPVMKSIFGVLNLPAIITGELIYDVSQGRAGSDNNLFYEVSDMALLGPQRRTIFA